MGRASGQEERGSNVNPFALSYKSLVNDFTTCRNKNACLIDRKEKRKIHKKEVCRRRLHGDRSPGLSAALGTLVLCGLSVVGGRVGSGHPPGPQGQGDLEEAHCEHKSSH